MIIWTQYFASNVHYATTRHHVHGSDARILKHAGKALEQHVVLNVFALDSPAHNKNYVDRALVRQRVRGDVHELVRADLAE